VTNLSCIVKTFSVGLILFSILQPEVCYGQSWIGRLLREAAKSTDNVPRKRATPKYPNAKLSPNSHSHDKSSATSEEVLADLRRRMSLSDPQNVPVPPLTPKQELAADRARSLKRKGVLAVFEGGEKKVTPAEQWVRGAIDVVGSVGDLVEALLPDETSQTPEQAWARHDAIMKMNQFLESVPSVFDSYESTPVTHNDSSRQVREDIRLFQILVVVREWARSGYMTTWDVSPKRKLEKAWERRVNNNRISLADRLAQQSNEPLSKRGNHLPKAAEESESTLMRFRSWSDKLGRWANTQAKKAKTNTLKTIARLADFSISCFKQEWRQLALLTITPTSVRDAFEVASYESFDRIRRSPNFITRNSTGLNGQRTRSDFTPDVAGRLNYSDDTTAGSDSSAPNSYSKTSSSPQPKPIRWYNVVVFAIVGLLLYAGYLYYLMNL
jgi:hypothetical protein